MRDFSERIRHTRKALQDSQVQDYIASTIAGIERELERELDAAERAEIAEEVEQRYQELNRENQIVWDLILGYDFQAGGDK